MWLREYFVSFGKILEVLYILITPSLCQSSLQISWWTSGETAPTTGQHVTTSSSNRARKETRKFDNSYSISALLKSSYFWTRIISLCIIKPYSIRYRTFTNLNIDKRFFLYIQLSIGNVRFRKISLDKRMTGYRDYDNASTTSEGINWG